MVELLRYLEANGFACYIASGGDRDFMRPITHDIYGIPPERVIGSSNGLRFQEATGDGGSVVYLAEPDVFDDGPVKPVRIWSRTGRRPLLAAGNANGDIAMLRFAGGRARPRCGCSSSTTTPSASSTTPPAPRRRPRARPAPAAGRWSASRDDWATVFA